MRTMLAVAAVLLWGGMMARADDAVEANALFAKLIAAEMAKDLDAFVADGTLQLKGALSKTQFDAVADQMNPRLANGYEVTPLGVLNQRGLEVYLYRLRFKDGSDDILGTMALKNGKVAGIFFK